jgi:general secretion pathway protein K
VTVATVAVVQMPAVFNRRPCAGQRGMVLIMALLIVVLVTAVVVSVSWRFTLSMARNENRWHGSQARAYLEGGEQLARKILRDDMVESSHDHLMEIWAQAGEPLPTDEGWIRGTIEDAHGRFNLNLLTAPPPPQQPVQGNPQQGRNPVPQDKFSESQKRFIRLLQTIELEAGPVPPQTAIEIVEAIQDWLDPDNDPFGFGGAEADYYEGMDPPYPITNGPMTSTSELSLIKGMTPEIYEKIVPLVIALPADAKMNINTLKPELLRTLNRKDNMQPLEDADWQVLVDERAAAQEGFMDVNTFLSSPNTQSVLGDTNQFDAADLVAAGNYFIFAAETLVGEQVRRSKTLLFRGNGDVVVVRRTDANF